MTAKHIPAGFDAEQLFAYLATFTPEQRRARRVFIRMGERGSAFNVRSLDLIEDDTYGFFGNSLPCLVLNDERFCPEEGTK